MRLANGIIIDKEKTFGVLKFSALRREVHIQNEDGTVSEEIKERTYDLKCKEQGRMIQVSIPATVPLKEFDYNTEVEIINPVADTVATATFQGADVDWYIKAGFPSINSCAFSDFIICQPLSWYCVPVSRPSKVTVSTIVTFLPATIDFSPVALSAAVVWIVISGSYSSVSVPKSITVLFFETTTSKAGISVIPLLESQRNSSIV